MTGATFTLPDELLEAIAVRAAELCGRSSTPISDEWFDVKGAAEYLRVKPSRIYQLKSMGVLEPDGSEGNRPRYRRSSLDAYLEGT